MGIAGEFKGVLDRRSGNFIRFTRTAGGATAAPEEHIAAADAAATAGVDWETAVEESELLSADGSDFDRETYLALERPSEGNPVQLYSQADADLFPLIVNMCVQPGMMCMSEMAAIDRQGGLGLAGIHNTLPLTAALSDRKAQPVFGAA